MTFAKAFVGLLVLEIVVIVLIAIQGRGDNSDTAALGAFEFFFALFISLGVDVIYLIVWFAIHLLRHR
jgi:hypothetical protein